MENGINTVCSDKGANLSGGQRARLNLSRVFYQNNSILLLDDPLKALDPETLKKILQNIKSLKSTKIFTSNNPLTARYSDRIIILKNGKVMYDGNYEAKTIEKYFPEIEAQESSNEQKQKSSPLN